MTLNHPVQTSKYIIHKMSFHRAWVAVFALGLFLISGAVPIPRSAKHRNHVRHRQPIRPALLFRTLRCHLPRPRPTSRVRRQPTDEGEYRAEFLPVGPYTVKVDAAGFKSMVQTGITLARRQEAALDFKLEPGVQDLGDDRYR